MPVAVVSKPDDGPRMAEALLAGGRAQAQDLAGSQPAPIWRRLTGFLLQDVNKQEEEYPDHVNEVPVPAGRLETEVIIGSEVLANQRAQQLRNRVRKAKHPACPGCRREFKGMTTHINHMTNQPSRTIPHLVHTKNAGYLNHMILNIILNIIFNIIC